MAAIAVTTAAFSENSTAGKLATAENGRRHNELFSEFTVAAHKRGPAVKRTVLQVTLDSRTCFSVSTR
ncbi:hypothetical protein [Streptomyces sp. URMC 129]|uniref:hypothetical protein n=1 Tax=Streptomyces sp. URMC 129 TaxID=3423407 RepID=UPI003F19C85B